MIEVAHLETWTPEARAELYDGEARPFGGETDRLGWRDKELHTVGRLDGRVVSHVGLTGAIAEPVTIDRPGGGTWPFPDVTMWRPLRPGVEWPPGAVRLHGLPF